MKTVLAGHSSANLFDFEELRGRERVFRDRRDAGRVLARMLEVFRGETALVLAIPSGGLPVADEIARRLRLPLDVAVASKITSLKNTEAGYGAVAFGGIVAVDDERAAAMGVGAAERKEDRERAVEKVRRRVHLFRGHRPFPDLRDCVVILVDDGIAAGLTMMAAAEAIRKRGAERVIIAAPTAHRSAAEHLGPFAESIFCPNIRSGPFFAVADAYEHWVDVPETEAAEILKQAWREGYG